MVILRGVAGAIMLFLGRELSFLFSAAMAAFLGFRLVPLLPAQWPAWSDNAFVIALAILAAIATLLNERAGYFVCGFLVGGYVLTEYYAPGVLAIPILPFIVGSVLGALIIGILTEWAMIVVSCLVGVYFVTGIMTLAPTPKTLVGAGLFIIGALIQAIIMRAQKQSER